MVANYRAICAQGMCVGTTCMAFVKEFQRRCSGEGASIMQDASDMQTTGTDLLNHHNVSLLDLAHMVNASPGAVCALVAGLLDDDELADHLFHGWVQFTSG